MESPLKEEEAMSNELYKAAMCGDIEYVENTVVSDDEDLCRKTSRLNNMVHIAIRHDNMDFAAKALKRFPHLLWEPDMDENTPFHFAAEFGRNAFVKEVCGGEVTTDLRRLRMKNSMGNTPLHSAIIHSQIEVAIILLEKDPELVTVLNDFAEAPLHLAIKHYPEHNDDWSKLKNQRCLSHMKNKKTNLSSDGYLFKEEEFVILIIGLIQKASKVAGWRDGSGLTPLHQAASVNKGINLSLISCMIEYYPECIEVCDTSGKTILHHLINRIAFLSEGDDFLRNIDVNCFINHQDKDGNTPLHLAAKHSDLILLELRYKNWNGDHCIKNKEGLSVKYYYNHSDEIQKFRNGKASVRMTDETHDILELGDFYSIMEHEEKIGASFYKSQDSEGRNIMHRLLLLIKSGCVIIPNAFIYFMGKVIVERQRFFDTDTDKNGDTPAHILAQLNPDIMFHEGSVTIHDDQRYSESFFFIRGKHDDDDDESDDNPITNNKENLYPGLQKPNDPVFFKSPYTYHTFKWVNLGNSKFFIDLILEVIRPVYQKKWLRMQNKKGNTCLHEAILANNYLVFTEFARQYEEAGGKLVNNQNETVVHLLATQTSTPPTTIDGAMIKIIKSDLNNDCNFLDVDGRTPIMRAVEVGNLSFAERLWDLMCVHNPKFNELKGRDGQTFWHLLAKLPRTSFDSIHSFFTKNDVCDQLKLKDKEENTALHLAIENRKFDTARFFLESYQKHNFCERLLDVRNKRGETPGEMIGSLSYLPHEFEKFIWEDPKMIGTRSIWGIPTTQMEGYVNTMGVIAALLTTITFTAAFTVPGGLDQEKGTPLLIDDPAFQVFFISNVFAMCFSMMDLFCLLWIMATGDKSKSVVLLDFSIILLLISFYMTLVTFMTGVYATLHQVKKWIAIVSLIPCSMLVLLMHRYFVIKLIIPFGKLILVLVGNVSNSAKNTFWYLRHPQNTKELCKKRIPLICGRRPKPEPELPMSSTD